MAAGVALLLEDEPVIALDIELTLTEAGFSVIWFTTCSAGLGWLRQNALDVAIIDMRLQDGASNPVAALLTERGIPFVVHSGADILDANSDPEFATGFWLSKPSRSEDLVAAVTRAVGS
jgi:DNA-binding response OmpR family regulator